MSMISIFEKGGIKLKVTIRKYTCLVSPGEEKKKKVKDHFADYLLAGL